MRCATMAACLFLAAPSALFAQAEDEADSAVDLNAIDALLGDQAVTGDDEMDPDATGGEATAADGEAETADEEGVPEPSDLTLAFNAYSLCASEAGAALEETGFALDVIGEEALLRCSGQRSAYVNAFYFSLLPRYPDAPEATVRASAERLVAQSDIALSTIVTDEVTALRETREAADESDAGETETAEEETESDA